MTYMAHHMGLDYLTTMTNKTLDNWILALLLIKEKNMTCGV